jgi:hypothetical protein
MGTRAVIALGDRLDVWIEEEALVFVDFEDRVALAAEVTPNGDYDRRPGSGTRPSAG